MGNRKINIMFLINRIGWDVQVAGAELQLLELIKGIDKTRFNPILVTLYSEDEIFKEVGRIKDVEAISVNRKGKFDFNVLLKIYALLRQKRVDIIQPFLTPATFFGLLPALINRTPVKIATERGGRIYGEKLGYRLYQKTQDFLTRFADAVVANSEAGREYLIDRGIKPAKTKVIYNGINTGRLMPDREKVRQIKSELKLPPDGLLIGMTSNLRPEKDYSTFLAGARIIHQTVPQARFAILGDGPSRQDIEKMVDEQGLNPFVTFFGNQKDVASYISCYDISCLCSKISEGCSNVVLESMGLGKPVVASDVGGNRELVGQDDCGILVPAQDPEAFAKAVLALLNQPNRAREIGEKGRNIVMTRFSLDRMVRDYEQLYEQLLKDKRIA